MSKSMYFITYLEQIYVFLQLFYISIVENKQPISKNILTVISLLE